jgi:O-antigen/teichoic acid export membrane protein
MSTTVAESVTKNTSIMLGQYFITSTLSFVLMMFLPRYLGPIDYGRIVLANSIVGILRIFVEYGGGYLVAKDVARNRSASGQTIVDATVFRFFIALIAFAAAVGFCHWAQYPAEEQLIVAIVGVGLLWKGAMTVLVASYQGHESMQYTSVASITENVFMTIVGIAALLLGGKAVIIAIISVTSSFLNFSVLVAFSRKIVSAFPKVNWKAITGQFKEAAPYFLLAIFGTIYYRIDFLMLSKMAPEIVVGWYGGGYRLFDILNFFPIIFTAAVYPVLSRLWGQEEQTHKRTTQRSIQYMILLSIPVSIAAGVFANRAVKIIYGLPAYGPSINVLRILVMGLPFLFVDMVIGTTLLASNKQRQQSILALAAIPLNMGMNFFLIPYYQNHFGNGGLGAAIATVITEMFIMVVGISLMPKGIFKGFRYQAVWKGLVAGGVMALFLWIAWEAGFPWLLTAFLSPFVYGATLLSLKTFEPVEQNFFIKLMKWRNLYALVTGLSKA